MKVKVIFSIPQECGDTNVVIIREDFCTVQMEFPEPYYWDVNTKSICAWDDTCRTYKLYGHNPENLQKVGDIDMVPGCYLERDESEDEVRARVIGVDITDKPELSYFGFAITYLVQKARKHDTYLLREEDEFIKRANCYGWDTSNPIWEASNRRSISYEDLLKKAVEDLFEEEVVDVIQL